MGELCIKIEDVHIHIHNHSNHSNDKKLDQILEAIEKWHGSEIKEITKMVKAAIRDLNSTPVK